MSSAWLASAVGVADTATQALGLQEDVTREAYIAPDGGFGKADTGPPELLKAVVDRNRGVRQKPGGQEIHFRATVAFPRPVAIDPRDKITLSDGLTGPIVDVDHGPADQASSGSLVTTVYLG